MSTYVRVLLVCVLIVVAWQRSTAAAEDDVAPALYDLLPGVQLTLLAEHPDVVTPTGIDVDAQGNVWVVSSHTHFRPDDYAGPESDEVLVFGAEGNRRVFYADTVATMDLELGADGWLYLSERSRVLRVRDSDGDGRGDQQQTIAVLDTEADYPHNGISGLAWHPSGDLVFALGENYWTPWTLTAADGTKVTGTGEGGIFRCGPDGSDLRRIAYGFWNPFGICIREDGEIFAAENDPGARPPCRLIHVVPGGDYGYQRLYGEAPFHPFVCWDGQLRGTLPMLHSTGEAPCGVAPLGDGLIVPSWTDHRIDYYPLRRDGASFATQRVVLARGGDHFRPTCITQTDPTTFYLTDWVFGSYQLHGRGRVWKLTIDPEKADWLGPLQLQPPNDAARLAQQLRSGAVDLPRGELLKLAQDADPFIAHGALQSLARISQRWQLDDIQSLPAEHRVTMTLVMKIAAGDNDALARGLLHDPDPRVRFESLRWIADRQLTSALPDVEALLRRPQTDYRLFEAALAAWNTLSGNPRAGVADPQMLLQRVRDTDASPRSRAYSLRLLPPQLDALTPKLLDELLQLGDPLLTSEVTRTLAARSDAAAQRMLVRIAEDAERPSQLRAQAISGLAGSAQQQAGLLVDLAESADRTVGEEALRSLRFVGLSAPHRDRIAAVAKTHPASSDLVTAVLDPQALKVDADRPAATDLPAWQARLQAISTPADPEAGRRIFFHAKVGMCATCHRHDGRGSVVGPDLTAVTAHGDLSADAVGLLISVLQPSRDVDPQYYPWSLVTVDGRVFTGIPLRNGGSGKEIYRDNTGHEQTFASEAIETRRELRSSMMPDGLVETMTDRELRDVLAFLQSGTATAAAAAGDAAAGDAGVGDAGVGDAGVGDAPADADPLVDFAGQWSLDFADGYGGWLSIERQADGPAARLLWRVGSPRPIAGVQLRDGQLHLFPTQRRDAAAHYIALRQGETIQVTRREADGQSQTASGRRQPPMPPRPDLAQVRFGKPEILFNGHDLTGWRLQPADAKNGWSARDGELVNTTPKEDFSSYGDYGNLRTERQFEDFRLHIEFNVASRRNSGIYLRGLYEVQVVDRDSPMQGINGPGAVFGRVAPTVNAGLPGGQWQSYDLTLVDRHVTVVLNGQKVIDNQPVEGCTGGALHGDVTAPGPIYLQGDHTSVRYRNIRLEPRLP